MLVTFPNVFRINWIKIYYFKIKKSLDFLKVYLFHFKKMFIHLKNILIVIKDEYLLQFHCSFQNFNGIVTLIPAENSVCILNKVEIKETTKLSQGKQFLKVYFFILKNF